MVEAPEQIRVRLPGGFQLPPFGIHQILALVIVSIALWALGAVWLGLQGVGQWVGSWQGEVQLHIYLPEKDGAGTQLAERLKTLTGVAAVEPVARRQAAEQMHAWLGDSGIAIDELAERLPDALLVTLGEKRSEFLLDDIRDEASRAGATVNEDELRLVQAHEIVEQLEWLAWFATLILALAMALIVSNTLRMILLARTDEIRLMRLMGAQEWFVRLPFVLEGILIGGGAGSVAWLLLWPLVFGLSGWFEGIDLYGPAFVLLLPLLLGGGLVGALGALVATTRIVADVHAEA